MTNPTSITFNSPDHDATYPSGDPKITHYDVSAFAAGESPHTGHAAVATYPYPKSEAVGSGPYVIAIGGLIALVPEATANGRLFVRGRNPNANGAWSADGVVFSKFAVPAPPTNLSVS